jgi:hypothetical protein
MRKKRQSCGNCSCGKHRHQKTYKDYQPKIMGYTKEDIEKFGKWALIGAALIILIKWL